MTLLRRFSANVLRYVANCEVDWVSLLATELCELSFVRRDNDRYNRNVLASSCSLDFFLKLW